MARKSEGFTLHRDKRTRYWIVRFTHNWHRYKRSTRECDRGSAQKIASEIVGAVTQGRAVSVVRASRVDIDVLVGQYLVDVSAGLAPETVATYQGYFLKNFGAAVRFTRRHHFERDARLFAGALATSEARHGVQGTVGHAGVPEMVP